MARLTDGSQVCGMSSGEVHCDNRGVDMLIHDIIKIKLVQDGYLPNYPYHLISDKEMCDAFIGYDDSYFYANYPCLVHDTEFEGYYNTLVSSIKYHVEHLKRSASTFEEESEESRNNYIFPDWVYSYMLPAVISVNSSERDIHDLAVLLEISRSDDTFDSILSRKCLAVSKQWIEKTQITNIVTFDGKEVNKRPYTVFGEPHVIKALRIQQADPFSR